MPPPRADKSRRAFEDAVSRQRSIAGVERDVVSRLMRFPQARKRDPEVEAWIVAHSGELGAIAQRWFEAMRRAGGSPCQD